VIIQSGNTFLWFKGRNINPSDAQICYRGQDPFSYGELIAGDTVAVYDWDLKKVTEAAEVLQKVNIATVERMWVGIGWGGEFLFVELKPTDSALANEAYVVDLYEKGNLRASTTASWNQPEINVSSKKLVKFPVTKDEYDAYSWEDVSHIFSAKVHKKRGGFRPLFYLTIGK